MPAIWNINNAYNINNKKVSSKLTFEVGEKFSGRIISKGEGNEAVIKLLDGWQFEAEIEGELNLDNQGLIKFEVEGFEDGKLKLKIVNREVPGQGFTGDVINEVIQKEGLLSEDIPLLRAMVKHNMPLTKENINFVKGLIQFNEKINRDPSEISSFVDKFLNVKGIGKSSEEGKVFTKVLNDFMEAFKGMDTEEVFLFLENDIELNKENIDSFNKLFKSERTLHEYFKGIENELKELDLDIESNLNSKTIESSIKKDEILVQNKNIELVNKEDIAQTSGNLASKVYDSNDVSKGKVSMLSLLKSLNGSENEMMKEALKGILVDRASTFTVSEFNRIDNLISNLSDNKLVEIFKESLNGDSNLIKENIESALKEFMGRDIKLSEPEFQKLSDILKLKVGEVIQSSSNEVITDLGTTSKLKRSLSGKEDLNLTTKDIIKDDIRGKLESIKNVVKELIQHAELSGKSSEKIMEFLKGSINDFKLLNSINNEYYYLDIPVRRDEKDYPCKLIIKDNRKDGKIIDKSNVKMVVSIKTVNIGTIDGYLKVKEKRLDVDLKCEEKFVKAIDTGKVKLVEGLNSLGFNTNIIVSKRTEEVGLTTCREFFNDDNTTIINTKV